MTPAEAMREAAAKALDVSADEIRLHAGEMTAQEMRSVKAVLKWRQSAIRALQLPAETSESAVAAEREACALTVEDFGGHFKALGETRQSLIDALAAAIRNRPALAISDDGWRPIESAPKGKKIIVGYYNGCGKWRSTMATYYLPGTLDACDSCNEADPNGYAPEGWYEESETYDEILPISGLTHWHRLPAPPVSDDGEKR